MDDFSMKEDSQSKESNNLSEVSKSRKRRCGMCIGCKSKECGKCSACRDKPKYGGKGIKKQCCLNRRCYKIMKNPSKQTYVSGSNNNKKRKQVHSTVPETYSIPYDGSKHTLKKPRADDTHTAKEINSTVHIEFGKTFKSTFSQRLARISKMKF